MVSAPQSAAKAAAAPLEDSFPPGLGNIYIFIVFNALSYQVILNSPMVLYAKSLEASATVLGIIAGMMPLLVIFQIPAAKHLARVGYKRFVFAGWGTRTMFIALMALVPLTGGFLNTTTRLALMLALLFAFNLARGITSCAWLPWITGMVPASLRGRYLVRDAACGNIGSFIVFLLGAYCLGMDPKPWQFAVLFAFSAVMGGASLNFLRKVPDTSAPTAARESTTPVPWMAIASHPPFRKLIAMNLAWSVAYGGLTTFVVAYLKSEGGWAEREIMLVVAGSFIGGLSSLWFLGHRLDWLGSKPVLIFSMMTWLTILGGWIFIAGKVVAPLAVLVVCLLFAMGLGYSLVNMATTRLAMATIPAMGRDHFFALYSVIGNVTLGLAPIFWGLFIDSLQGVRLRWHCMEFNRFSLFFVAAMMAFVVTLFLSRRLEEPKAASMEALLKDLWQQSPLRFWERWWTRGEE